MKLIVTALATLGSFGLASPPPLRLVVNRVPVPMKLAPIEMESTVLLPLVEIAGPMRGTLVSNSVPLSLTVDRRRIEFRFNESIATVNGTPRTFSHSPKIIDGNGYIPTAMLEALAFKVTNDRTNNSLYLRDMTLPPRVLVLPNKHYGAQADDAKAADQAIAQLMTKNGLETIPEAKWRRVLKITTDGWDDIENVDRPDLTTAQVLALGTAVGADYVIRGTMKWSYKTQPFQPKRVTLRYLPWQYDVESSFVRLYGKEVSLECKAIDQPGARIAEIVYRAWLDQIDKEIREFTAGLR